MNSVIKKLIVRPVTRIIIVTVSVAKVPTKWFYKKNGMIIVMNMLINLQGFVSLRDIVVVLTITVPYMNM